MLKDKSTMYPTAIYLAMSRKILYYENNAHTKFFAELFRSSV